MKIFKKNEINKTNYKSIQYSSFKIHKDRNTRALHLGTPTQN